MKEDKKHFVITGPESTGKSTLWKALHMVYPSSVFIPEVARDYLEKNGPTYDQQDVQHIAYLQFQKQLDAFRKGHSVIISDTCLLTIYIWQKEKYGYVDAFTEEWFHLQKVDHYFILYPDFPWVADPLRESEGKRMELFEKYLKEIEKIKIDYTILRGNKSHRLEEIVKKIDNLCSRIL